jgi:hypothetical protein
VGEAEVLMQEQAALKKHADAAAQATAIAQKALAQATKAVAW